MHKAEITRFEKLKANLCIGVNVSFVVEGIVPTHEVTSIKDGVGRPENIQSLKKVATAYLQPRNARTRGRADLSMRLVPLRGRKRR